MRLELLRVPVPPLPFVISDTLLVDRNIDMDDDDKDEVVVVVFIVFCWLLIILFMLLLGMRSSWTRHQVSRGCALVRCN